MHRGVVLALAVTLTLASPLLLPPVSAAAPAVHLSPATYLGNVSLYGSEVVRCWSGAVHFVNSCSESVPVIPGSTVVLFAYEGSSVTGIPAVGDTFAFTATFDGIPATNVGVTQAPGIGTCIPTCTTTGFGLAVTAFVVPLYASGGSPTATVTWTNTSGTDTVVWLDAVVLGGLEPTHTADSVLSNSTVTAQDQARVDLTTTEYGDVLVMGLLGYSPTIPSASTNVYADPLNQGVLGSSSFTANTTTRCNYCSAASFIAQPLNVTPGVYGIAANFTTGVHPVASPDHWIAIGLSLNATGLTPSGGGPPGGGPSLPAFVFWLLLLIVVAVFAKIIHEEFGRRRTKGSP